MSSVPPPGSPFHTLHEELRETLVRSYQDRIAGAADSRFNLDNAFWGGTPSSTWEALERLTPMGVNILVRLFDRIRAIDGSFQAWRGIRYIRNVWWTGSAGVKVVYKDPPAMRARLDELLSGPPGHRVARDTYLGAMEHQSKPMKDLVLQIMGNLRLIHAPPPDADTWREVSVLGQEATHFCIGKHDLVDPTGAEPRPVPLDDIHIDWMSPVKGVDEHGRCDYDFGTSIEHWLQAMQRRGEPPFTFDVIRKHIADAKGSLSSSSPAGLAAKVADFEERWRVVEWDLAVAGMAGYELSKPYMEEAMSLTA